MDGAWENKEIAPEFLNVIETETDRMDAYDYRLTQLIADGPESIRALIRSSWIWMSWWSILWIDLIWCFNDQYIEKNYRISNRYYPKTSMAEIDQDKMTQALIILSTMRLNILQMGDGYCSTDGNSYGFNRECEWWRIRIPRKDIPHLFDRFYREIKLVQEQWAVVD